MNDIIHSAPMPLPETNLTIRPGTLADVDFLDALQRKTTKQVGFMPRKQFEGKIAAGHVLIAEESEQWAVGSGQNKTGEQAMSASLLPTAHCPPPTRVGYLIGNDQYFKHDDVGIIYQMNVVPERRRSLVAARLLQAQFARSAYGCKLYCCWCAQDIEANRFWESMGFVPLAYRAGGVGSRQWAVGRKEGDPPSLPTAHRKLPTARVHIFWQKRIRQGDETTPWWFPSLTSGGSIREDRLVLPIPPGMHWSDAKPLILPGVGSGQCAVGSEAEQKALPAPRKRRSKSEAASSLPTAHCPPPTRSVPTMGMGRLSFFDVPTPAVVAPEPAAVPAVVEKPKRKPKPKHDPALVSAARELRDRYLEHYNASPIRAIGAKYEVGRRIEGAPTPAAIALLPAA